MGSLEVCTRGTEKGLCSWAECRGVDTTAVKMTCGFGYRQHDEACAIY